MELEERSRLSYYREIESLNAEHGVELVRHSENGLFFVRKRLVNYQKEIFLQLKNDPVSNMPRIIEAVEDNGYLIVIETYLGGKTLQSRPHDVPAARIRQGFLSGHFALSSVLAWASFEPPPITL